MAKYAQGTEVSVTSSKAEVERLIYRYGGDLVSMGWAGELTAVVGFRFRKRFLKTTVRLPPTSGTEFEKLFRWSGNRQRTSRQMDFAREAEVRRRWRVLVLRLKSKFETVDSEPDLFDEEFMPFVLLPSGETVGEWMQPQLAEAYQSGQMPARMLLLPGARE